MPCACLAKNYPAVVYGRRNYSVSAAVLYQMFCNFAWGWSYHLWWLGREQVDLAYAMNLSYITIQQIRVAAEANTKQDGLKNQLIMWARKHLVVLDSCCMRCMNNERVPPDLDCEHSLRRAPLMFCLRDRRHHSRWTSLFATVSVFPKPYPKDLTRYGPWLNLPPKPKILLDFYSSISLIPLQRWAIWTSCRYFVEAQPDLCPLKYCRAPNLERGSRQALI